MIGTKNRKFTPDQIDSQINRVNSILFSGPRLSKTNSHLETSTQQNPMSKSQDLSKLTKATFDSNATG